MKYKETARSPHYGKIYGYDNKGKQIEELDLLRIVVCKRESEKNCDEYTIGQLLRTVVEHKEDFKKIAILEKQIKQLQNKIDTMSKLMVLLDAEIKASKLK